MREQHTIPTQSNICHEDELKQVSNTRNGGISIRENFCSFAAYTMHHWNRLECKLLHTFSQNFNLLRNFPLLNIPTNHEAALYIAFHFRRNVFCVLLH